MNQQRFDKMQYTPYALTGIESVKQEMIEEALLRSIVVDQLPFLLVESGTFKELFARLDPRFRLPCRQTVSKRIGETFIRKREEVKGILRNEPGKVSITTDIWTACNQVAFLGITMHWIDQSWKMRLLLLDIVPLHDAHTGNHIAEAIHDVLRDFDLGRRLLAVTTDNGSNMVSMYKRLCELCSQEFKNSEIVHLRCAAHVLNLAAKAGLEHVSAEVKKARAFSSKLHYSVLLLGEMEKIASGIEMKCKMLQVDVATRWNSSFLMLKRLEEIRMITDMLVVKKPNLAANYPSNDEWEVLKVCA